jgi:hypothetical protein
MRFIDYTFEDKQGSDKNLRVEYTIIPFRGDSHTELEDDIEIVSVIETDNKQEIDLDDETLNEIVTYIRENDEDYLGEEFFL